MIRTDDPVLALHADADGLRLEMTAIGYAVYLDPWQARGLALQLWRAAREEDARLADETCEGR